MADLVRKYGPWSASKAEVAYGCTRKFAVQYRDKRQEGMKHRTARVGNAAHSMQELVLQKPMTEDELFELAQKYAADEKNALTYEERVGLFARLPAITQYGDRIAKFKRERGVTMELIEHKLAMTFDWLGCPFKHPDAFLRGVLDHGLITQDRVLVMIDHKSGKKQHISKHSTQIYIYMALAVSNFPDIVGVQSGINYVGTPVVDWFPKPRGQPGIWSRAEINDIVKPWLTNYLDGMRPRLNIIEQHREAPAVGWQCEFCGFKDLCPEGKASAEAAISNRALKARMKLAEKGGGDADPETEGDADPDAETEDDTNNDQ